MSATSCEFTSSMGNGLNTGIGASNRLGIPRRYHRYTAAVKGSTPY